MSQASQVDPAVPAAAKAAEGPLRRDADAEARKRLFVAAGLSAGLALLWWAVFYANLAGDLGQGLLGVYGEALPCLVFTTERCRELVDLLAASYTGRPPTVDPFLVYSPWVFVIAFAQLGGFAALYPRIPEWARIWIYRIFALEVIVLVWWIASSTSTLVPTPLETWNAAMVEFARTCPPNAIPGLCKTVWTALFGLDIQNKILGSVVVYLFGFGLAALIGIPIGLLLGGYRPLGRTLEIYINGLMATPRIAFIPLIILFLGLFYQAKIFIIFLGAVMPIIVNTYAGVLNADGELVEMARSAGAKRSQIFRRILLPGSLPFIVVGLRLGATIGLINTIVAELYTANSGLGSLLRLYSQNFQMAQYFVIVIVLATLGIIVTQSLRILETRMDRWRYRAR